MEMRSNITSNYKKSAIGNACALLVGIIVSLALSKNATKPVLSGGVANLLVNRASWLLFNPVTYIAVAIVFALVVIRARGIGLWSIFSSFMVGGLLASFVLSV
jgi:hypothetical protein